MVWMLVLVGCSTTSRKDSQNYSTEGVWKPISGVLSGNPVSEDVLSMITLHIFQGRYVVDVSGRDISDQGLCEINESTNPKRFTIQGTEGPNKGRVYYAIFEFDGPDLMRVLYDMSGERFPDSFDSRASNDHYCVEYKRVQ